MDMKRIIKNVKRRGYLGLPTKVRRFNAFVVFLILLLGVANFGTDQLIKIREEKLSSLEFIKVYAAEGKTAWQTQEELKKEYGIKGFSTNELLYEARTYFKEQGENTNNNLLLEGMENIQYQGKGNYYYVAIKKGAK